LSRSNTQIVENLNDVKRLDREELKAFHDHYYPMLYRYVYFRLGDVQCSDEITMQVFSKLIGFLGGRRGLSKKIGAWLFDQAKSLVEKQMHGQSASSEQNHVMQLTTRYISRQDAASIHERYQNIRFVRPALLVLSNQEQHYLALRFTQSLTLEEIAVLMGISMRRVHSLQVRALTSFGRAFNRIA